MGSNLKPEEIVPYKEAHGILPAHAKQETRDLPTWVKLALARCEVYDETYKEAAEHYRRTSSTLAKYPASPAGRKWRAALVEAVEDPVQIATMLVRSNAIGVTMDAFWSLETAKSANDYKEAGLITRDLMDRIPELRKQTQAVAQIGATQIVIQLGGGASLEPAQVETSHTKQLEPTLDAEFELEDER